MQTIGGNARNALQIDSLRLMISEYGPNQMFGCLALLLSRIYWLGKGEGPWVVRALGDIFLLNGACLLDFALAVSSETLSTLAVFFVPFGSITACLPPS